MRVEENLCWGDHSWCGCTCGSGSVVPWWCIDCGSSPLNIISESVPLAKDTNNYSLCHCFLGIIRLLINCLLYLGMYYIDLIESIVLPSSFKTHLVANMGSSSITGCCCYQCFLHPLML